MRVAHGYTRLHRAVYRRVMPDSLVSRLWTTGSDGYSVLCTRAADSIREVGAFSEPEQWRVGWERSYSRDEWLDQLPTTGGHTRLPPARPEEVLAGIGAAIDAVGGNVTMHYATVAVTAARSGPT